MAEKDENLRNEIDVELPYVNSDGVKGIKVIHIAFISQGIYDGYTDLIRDAQEAINLGNKINSFTNDLGYAVAVNKLENDKDCADLNDKLRQIRKECDNATARLVELANNTMQKKFRLITKILKKNGVEDADLYDIEWWKECVQMYDIMRFIKEACTKDDDEEVKKKL